MHEGYHNAEITASDHVMYHRRKGTSLVIGIQQIIPFSSDPIDFMNRPAQIFYLSLTKNTPQDFFMEALQFNRYDTLGQ
ncbi:MAG: hypothetical protein O7G88_02780 [bacterium]|nr:hypothetical protein [bacterium]